MQITLGQQYNVGEKPTVILYIYINHGCSECCLKKNVNASRPSEHPSVSGENVKTFRSDHRLQSQNIFKAFKRVSRW